jgi:hypothetical protein
VLAWYYRYASMTSASPQHLSTLSISYILAISSGYR